MCFTPKISLTTAIVEFLTSGWIYYRYPKHELTNFFVRTIILLGIYQFTEFMLCTSNNVQVWGKLGFITYTLIPPTIVFSIIKKEKIKFIHYLLFLPSLIFILTALLDKNFIIYGTCSTLFVEIANRFTSYGENTLTTFIYNEYYFFYIAITTVYLIRRMREAKTKTESLTSLLIIISSPLIVIPPLVLLVFIPSIGIKFSSMYCQFAMALTLTALISLHYEEKIRKNKFSKK